jgi:GDPmannose 4,6-dehydratase
MTRTNLTPGSQPRRALITGISGQDGAYLAELLLKQGYEVYGAYRRSSSSSLWRLAELGIGDAVTPAMMDLAEFSNVLRTVERVRPDEVYNLGAQSFVAASFDQPIYTADVTGTAVTRLLEAIRTVNPGIRFYQASTSEMFGKVQAMPQCETTPFYPRSPYGVAKLYGHWITVNYRESYGLHASSGILFNHESPLRGAEFVTRKITRTMAEIVQGRAEVLELGNLDARRDWGFAGDYVRGMWQMVQQPAGGEYVLATGITHSVREFVGWAGEAAGLPLEWSGAGVSECGRDRRSGRVLVRVNSAYYRPAEVDVLVGDATRAREQLGWRPEVAVRDLVHAMVEADLRRAARGLIAC